MFRCQKYAQYCCGLDCCDITKTEIRSVPEQPMKYPWSKPVASTATNLQQLSPFRSSTNGGNGRNIIICTLVLYKILENLLNVLYL